MKRRLLNLLTILSLLLCVLVLALWVRSNDPPRSVSIAGPRGGCFGASSYGDSLVLWWESAGAMDVVLLRDDLVVVERPAAAKPLRFHYEREDAQSWNLR